MTSFTPVKPRAVRSRKNANQPAPSSLDATCRPRISRCPSPLTPVATITDTVAPTAFPDLVGQGVGGDECVWAGVQGPGAEVSDVVIELLGHLGDL